ncbi:MAG: DUF4358 domain-containing protein [Eubacteriales bacterium]|jgi:hypothetical protein
MKRELACLLAVCGLTAALAGCGEDKQETAQTPQEIAESMMSKRSEEAPPMSQLNDKQITKLYNLEEDQLTAAVVYICDDNLRCDELAVLQPAEGQEDAVKEAVQARFDTKLNSFKDYLPDEYALMEEGEVVQSGNLIVLVAGMDSSDMLDALPA